MCKVTSSPYAFMSVASKMGVLKFCVNERQQLCVPGRHNINRQSNWPFSQSFFEGSFSLIAVFILHLIQWVVWYSLPYCRLGRFFWRSNMLASTSLHVNFVSRLDRCFPFCRFLLMLRVNLYSVETLFCCTIACAS